MIRNLEKAAQKSTLAYNQRKNDEWNKRYEVQTPENPQRNTGPGNKARPLCRNCDTRHPRVECPAYKQKCYGCNRLGHYVRVCTHARNGRRERENEPQGTLGEKKATHDVTIEMPGS